MVDSFGMLLVVRRVRETPVARHTRLRRELREIDKLPTNDRKAVLRVLDGLLARQKLAGGAR